MAFPFTPNDFYTITRGVREMNSSALKIEPRNENGGGTALQQELSDVTAELSKCVTRLHELSARKARLELRVLVGQ